MEFRTGKNRLLYALLAPLIALALVMAPAAPALAYTQREEIVSNGHGYLDADYLIIHETANPGASAANHVRYWRNNQPNVPMTQYVMELDGSTVYHTQRDDRVAWHIGNGNRHAVGIELAHATNRADFLKQWEEATQWAADYLNSRGWGIDRMLSHQECIRKWGGTDHTDPLGYFHKYGKTWGEFESTVAAKMAGGSMSKPTSGLGDTNWTGPKMVSELQRQLGTTVDGHISGQHVYNAYTVQWAIQVSPAEYPYYGSKVVRSLQRFLNTRGYSVGRYGVDGHMGHDTVRALQRFLLDNGISVGPSGVDGMFGNDTSRGFGVALERGLFRG